MEDWLTKVLDKVTEKGEKKGMETGRGWGKAENLVKCVDFLMQNEGYSKERACTVLGFTVDEYEEAKMLLTENAVSV